MNSLHNKINYQDKKVVILGLGVTGLSCVNYFLNKGVIPIVMDSREQPPGINELDPKVTIHCGEFVEEVILRADVLVVSPGLALSTPIIAKAISNGIDVVGDIELFCREVNEQQNAKVVAITGSNGKTTVTTLVGEILKQAGKSVGVGGNIGEPALNLLLSDYDYYVLELSSFQLETTSHLKCVVSTILNVSDDHMDRYPEGLTQYAAAKERIYADSDYAIVNVEDALTYPHNRRAKVVTFGLNQAQYHLDDRAQNLMIDEANILPTDQMTLMGKHNYLNSLVALAISDILGISRESCLETLRHFKGLPHRFECVYDNNGITWIDDSKATNVGSTIAALSSVVCQGTLHLLLGGDGKAADFSPLIPYLNHKNIAIYCFGRDGAALSKLNPECSELFTTMREAVTTISTKITSNDVVLLSPACASLDQFKNYAERGDQFAQLARELG